MNTWCVINNDCKLAGYHMYEIKAKILANELNEKEPDEGWEAMDDKE